MMTVLNTFELEIQTTVNSRTIYQQLLFDVFFFMLWVLKIEDVSETR
jgi:hypothetical protein